MITIAQRALPANSVPQSTWYRRFCASLLRTRAGGSNHTARIL